MSPLSIGKSIAYFRERAGLTKSELAERTGLSPSSITQYENGNRNPSDTNLEVIAAALNVSPWHIKNFAENILKQGPIIDESRLRRKLDIIHSQNDVVIELSEYVLLAIRSNVHDLLFELSDNQRRVGIVREIKKSPVQAVIEKVMREFLYDNLENISYRIQEELKRTEITVDDILNNIRNDFYR